MVHVDGSCPTEYLSNKQRIEEMLALALSSHLPIAQVGLKHSSSLVMLLGKVTKNNHKSIRVSTKFICYCATSPKLTFPYGKLQSRNWKMNARNPYKHCRSQRLLEPIQQKVDQNTSKSVRFSLESDVISVHQQK